MMKAFPSIESPLESENNRLFPISAGMDLRDYFAAKAMQAMIGNCEGSNFDDFVIAKEAYQMADFMLTERDNHA